MLLHCRVAGRSVKNTFCNGILERENPEGERYEVPAIGTAKVVRCLKCHGMPSYLVAKNLRRKLMILLKNFSCYVLPATPFSEAGEGLGLSSSSELT